MGRPGDEGWFVVGRENTGDKPVAGSAEESSADLPRELLELHSALQLQKKASQRSSGSGAGSAKAVVDDFIASERSRRRAARLARRALAALVADSGLGGPGSKPWLAASAADGELPPPPSTSPVPNYLLKQRGTPSSTPGHGVSVRSDASGAYSGDALGLGYWGHHHSGASAGGAAAAGAAPSAAAAAGDSAPVSGGDGDDAAARADAQGAPEGGGRRSVPLRTPPAQLPPPVGGCSGPHEDDLLFPEPSTANCRMLQDAFDVCSYEHVCFDLPGPFRPDNRDDPPVLWMVGSESLGRAGAGSGKHFETYGPPTDGSGDGEGGPHLVEAAARAAAAAEADAEGGGDDVAGAPASSADRACRHAHRLAPHSGGSGPRDILRLARDHNRYLFDTVFVDVTEDDLASRPRVLPWASFMRTGVINPSDTVSAAHGGSYNGTVTWVDNLWVAMTMVNAHLWSFGANVAFPLFGAWVANQSMGMGLPPADNFLVYNTEGWKKDRLDLPSPFDWHGGNEGKWSQGFLRNLLTYVHPHRAEPYNGKVPSGKAGRYPAVEAVLAAAYAQAAADGKVPKLPPGQTLPAFNGSDTSGTYGGVFDALLPYLPAQVPWEFLTLRNNASLGSRILWNLNDVPLPPWPYAAAAAAAAAAGGGEGAGGGAKDARAAGAAKHGNGATGPAIELRRRRICAKRAVLVGEKPMLISGPGEATAIREFGFSQLGVPRPEGGPLALAPKRIALIDRGRASHAGTVPVKPRGFANVRAVQGVLEKYSLNYDLITDKNLSALAFPQQAQLFSRYGLVIMAHGAGETNFAWLPRRAAVIEVSPMMMWCPLYIKYLAGLGHSVFPIFSRLKGPLLDWNVWEGPESNMSSRLALANLCERNSLPNIARHKCWHEAKMAAVQVPIHEFEHTLLRALDVVGIKKFPIDSAFDLIEGLPSGGPDVAFWTEGHYERVGWKACPPNATDMSQCVN